MSPTAREDKTHAEHDGAAEARAQSLGNDVVDQGQLLQALQAVAEGDFSVSLPGDRTGMSGKIADAFNRIVASNLHVDHVGRLSDAQLADAYRGATALLFTSRAEGFGLPPIEAMACGTPVIAFQNTSMPEVVGDGGILVRDGDVDALVRNARRLIESIAYREDVAAAGLRRARDVFDWTRCARETAAVYVEAAGVR